MSNENLFNMSDGYILLCGIDWWDISMEKKEGRNYRYLASIWATNNLAGIVISVKILARNFPNLISA